MFDQVMVRPELLSSFRNQDLKILTNVDEQSLLNASGFPNRSLGSDHLPVLFRIDL